MKIKSIKSDVKLTASSHLPSYLLIFGINVAKLCLENMENMENVTLRQPAYAQRAGGEGGKTPLHPVTKVSASFSVTITSELRED